MAGPASAVFVLPQLSANHRAQIPRSSVRKKAARFRRQILPNGHRTEEELDSEVEDGLTVKGSHDWDGHCSMAILSGTQKPKKSTHEEN